METLGLILVICGLLLALTLLYFICHCLLPSGGGGYIMGVAQERTHNVTLQTQRQRTPAQQLDSQLEEEIRLQIEQESAEKARSEYNAAKQEKEVQVRQHQNLLLELNNWSPSQHVMIIGVDATPTRMGGYCIDATNKTCQFYSFPTEYLPWTLKIQESPLGDSKEFETKNLMFALLLWQEDMMRYETPTGQQIRRRILVCTDNFEILKKKTDYGRRANNLLVHLQSCERLPIEIRVFGTDDKWIRNHAKYVKVADDLSRGNFKTAKDFLSNYFGIKREDITGTHKYNVHNGNDVLCSIECNKYLTKMKRNQFKYISDGCSTCQFSIERTDSLQSIKIKM